MRKRFFILRYDLFFVQFKLTHCLYHFLFSSSDVFFVGFLLMLPILRIFVNLKVFYVLIFSLALESKSTKQLDSTWKKQNGIYWYSFVSYLIHTLRPPEGTQLIYIFQHAVQSVTPSESQKLPSEIESKDVPMEEDTSHITISDDFYSAPSTSNSRIVFNIYNEQEDCSLSITLSDNDTVGRYTLIECRSCIMCVVIIISFIQVMLKLPFSRNGLYPHVSK